MIDFLELILELVNVKSRNELVALLVIGGVLAIIYYLFLVMVRENFPKLQMEEKIAHIKNLFPADIRLLKCDRMDVSSTQVRKLLRAKSQADGYRSPKRTRKNSLECARKRKRL